MSVVNKKGRKGIATLVTHRPVRKGSIPDTGSGTPATRRQVGRGSSDSDIRTPVTHRSVGRGSSDPDIRTPVTHRSVGRGSSDSDIRTPRLHRKVGRGSSDSDIRTPVTQRRVGRGNSDPDILTPVTQRRGERGCSDPDIRAPDTPRKVGRGSSDLDARMLITQQAGRRGSICSGSYRCGGRRASLDYGQGSPLPHTRHRRSSVDIERQRVLYEELAKRKHVQTVKERQRMVQLQSDATNRLQGPSMEKEGKIDDCLTKDPNLREDQVKIILQSFSTLDENGDGRISKREIARAYRLAGFNPTKKEIEKIVLEHDDNDDGYIDFEEYFNVMRTKMITMDFEKERLKTAFKVLDLDQDGYITKEELKHALSKSGDTFTEEEIKNIIDRADKNLDGKIDYDEYVEAELCKSVF